MDAFATAIGFVGVAWAAAWMFVRLKGHTVELLKARHDLAPVSDDKDKQ